MRKSHLYLTIILLILLSLTCSACSTQGASGTISGTEMSQANRLYENGEFSKAAEHYQALINAGVNDGRVYYNLGNAYFKMGDLGRSVLNFRRAQILLPRDGDVAANLELARSQTLDAIESEEKGIIVKTVRRIFGWTTLDEASIAVLVLWGLLCGLGISAILWRKRRQVLLYLLGGVTFLLLLGVLSISIRLVDETSLPPAVIVAQEVSVRSGPGDDYLTEFTLHAGAEVRVVEERSHWTRITLPGDVQGWAPSDAVIELFHD